MGRNCAVGAVEIKQMLMKKDARSVLGHINNEADLVCVARASYV